MTNSGPCRHGILLFVMAWVCALTALPAQTAPPEPNPTDQPDIRTMIVNYKQALSMVIDHPSAEYPAVARVNYIQGRVALEVTVDEKGRVVAEHVLEGDALLAASALKAVGEWKYRPLDGPDGPSGYVTTVRFAFSLVSRGLGLSPKQAERDFLRRLKPAVRIKPAVPLHPSQVVHVRALLNDQGQVLDVESQSAGDKLEAARASMHGWVYRPARWGTLPVASYVEEDVPLAPALASANPEPGD